MSHNHPSSTVKELTRPRPEPASTDKPLTARITEAKRVYTVINGKQPTICIMYGSLRKKLVEEGWTSMELDAAVITSTFLEMRPLFTFDLSRDQILCAR